METATQFQILPQEQYNDIFTSELVTFLSELHSKFNDDRIALLHARTMKQVEFDHGQLPKFLPETEEIRNGNWVCNALPKDLLDRRVEITGPVERKMIINALNSGSSTFMADFEDSRMQSTRPSALKMKMERNMNWVKI